MRPKRDAVPRAREAWWWLGSLLTLGFLGAGVVAAGVALWQQIDIRQLTPGLADALPPIPEPLGAKPPAISPSGFSAVILRSTANQAYFEDPQYYDAEIDRWTALIEESGGSARQVTGAAQLTATRAEELMVLPEAPCLAPDELAALNGHLRNGGSVVANWAIGARDENCEWRGWDPLLDLAGAEDVREIPTRQGLFLTIPGGLPVSPGLDPGTRIELRPDPSLALRMSGERVYWSDWALNPAPDEEGAAADVAIVTRATDSGGRVAWFGLRTRQAATAPDSTKLDRLLQNGLLWAAGVPMASPSPWPDARQAALVFALDVEGENTYVNARDAAATFSADSLPITFFAVSGVVSEDRALGEDLSAAGDVGSQTVDHTPLAGLTPQDQSMRLQRSWDQIEQWVGVGPAGLRPPEEAFDSTTLQMWRRAGGTYLLGGNESRSASPEIHATTNGPVILLPRLVKDDYDIIVRDVTVRAESLGNAYWAGVRKIRAIGGLAVVLGHTQIIASGPRLNAMHSIADSARAQGDWWVAGADDVATWWLNRSRLELRWDGRDLLASMPSGMSIDNLWVDVVAPPLSEGAIPLVDGVSVDFDTEPWGVRVRVGSLVGGQVRRISFGTRENAAPSDGRLETPGS